MAFQGLNPGSAPLLRVLRKLLWQGVCLSLIASVAIACQPDPAPSEPTSPTPTPTVSPTGEPSPSAEPTSPTSENRYEDEQFGFQFTYPDGFVVEPSIEPSNGNPAPPLHTINIWTTEHSEAIKAGEYEGGTEYPANVTVVVHNNADQQGLRDWVQGYEWFTGVGEITDTTVAGQEAIAFSSTGLYDMEHVAFQSPDRNTIMLISFAKVVPENDAVYQVAFQEVLSSFQF